MLAPCAACYNRLSAARLAVADEDGMAERMPDILGRPFANTVEVQNVVELLRGAAAAIEEKVAAALAPNPLEGLKMAAYYGCLLVRPVEVCGYDDPEQPRLDGRGHQRLRRRRRRLEHEGRVLRRRASA